MLQRQHKTFALGLKAISDAGTFDGLLSVYGNVDLGGDRIEPGAFKQIELTADGHIRILDGHDTKSPIGKGLLRDSPEGLWISGKLNLEIQRAREILSLMKDRVVDGLSIGYDVLPGGSAIEKGVRVLTGLKLWEASLVTFPMNPAAKVVPGSVKALYPTPGDLEKLLRANGFSKRTASVMASAAHAARAKREGDEEPDFGADADPELKAAYDMLREAGCSHSEALLRVNHAHDQQTKLMTVFNTVKSLNAHLKGYETL